MGALKINPDMDEFQPSLLLLLTDGFTGANTLAGDVTATIAQTDPPLEKDSEATFVFVKLANGSYVVNVRSVPDEPFYSPVDIPITLPFQHPTRSLWPKAPIWPAYPDIVLADPTKLLDDPEQPPAYLAQRALAALQPTTSYPFPAGATLVRGTVYDGKTPLSGALVTTAIIATAGQFPIVVKNTTGAASNARNLAVVSAPVLTALDPATALVNSPAFTLASEGSGFAPGAVVEINGVALPTTFIAAAQLDAQVQAAQLANPGALPMVVRNPDGTASDAQSFEVVAAPVIASIAPASVTAGSAAFTLTVQGSGFPPAAVVEVNSVPLATAFVSDTQLTAQVPAADIAAVAQLSIAVAIPGPPAQVSNAQPLAVVNTPVITSLDPPAVVAGSGALTLAVEGTGFAAGSIVNWNGAALPTTFAGPTQLNATVSSNQVSQAGQFSVQVANSNVQTLSVIAAPSIDSLTPQSVSAGSGSFILTVRGKGFAPGAKVQLNGDDLPTTFVDSEQLDAHVRRSGYTTADDGAFVLFFDDIEGRSQTITLVAKHPRFPNPKSQDVAVLRGATVSVAFDMSS